MTDTQVPQKGAQHLTDANFDETIKNAGMPVLVDFYAEWCGPCKLAGPIIDRMSEELKGKVLIVKLDVDDNQASAQKYGVMSIPTVIVFNKVGEEVKEVDRKIGFPGEQGYRQMIAKVTPTT
jgi:thioredoxin 1